MVKTIEVERPQVLSSEVSEKRDTRSELGELLDRVQKWQEGRMTERRDATTDQHELTNILAEMDTVDIEGITRNQAQQLIGRMHTVLQGMERASNGNVTLYRKAHELYAKLYKRSSDLGFIPETADKAVDGAQGGAILTAGTTILGSTVLGPVGGAIAGVAGGMGTMWLANKLGEWGAKIGIPPRLTKFLAGAGVVAGTLALVPAAWPGAAIGAGIGGLIYALNRLGQEKK